MKLIKIIILFLIFILSVIIGKLISEKYILRLKELEDLKSYLNLVKSKIKFTYEPIPEIFNEIAKEYLLLDNDYVFESSSGGSGGASDEQVLTAIAELSAKVTAGFEAGAKSSQISGLATTSQLNNGVENIREDIADVRGEINDIDTKVNSIALDVSALRASSLAYKNEIIGSIEGVSTDEY